MNTTFDARPNFQPELAQVLEPLASYICAADRPAEALRAAITRLLEEVKTTNAAAVRYFCVISRDSLDLAL